MNEQMKQTNESINKQNRHNEWTNERMAEQWLA